MLLPTWYWGISFHDIHVKRFSYSRSQSKHVSKTNTDEPWHKLIPLVDIVLLWTEFCFVVKAPQSHIYFYNWSYCAWFIGVCCLGILLYYLLADITNIFNIFNLLHQVPLYIMLCCTFTWKISHIMEIGCQHNFMLTLKWDMRNYLNIEKMTHLTW